MEKIRHALSVRHLVQRNSSWEIADHRLVRAVIQADASRIPVLAIDGREVSCPEFGRMIADYEGWQPKLEIRDRSEET